MKHFIRYSLLLTFFCYANLGSSVASTTATSALPACVQDGTCKYTISTFAGSNPGDNDGTTSTAAFQNISMVVFDPNKNMYVLSNNNKIRKIDKSGNVTTIINSDRVPGSIAVDTLGNFYIYDRSNPKIFKYQNGSYTNPVVIAGNDAPGTPGYAQGAAFHADLSNEAWGGLITDNAGNIYISDTQNHVIKKLTLTNGTYVLSIIAGTNKSSGYDNNTNNGNKAIGAKLNQPEQLAIDASGNIYVGDKLNHAIRKLTPKADGSYTISTLAGTGSAGFSGDGALATNAQLNITTSIAVDGVGNLYISDTNNKVIRFISAKTGIISTIAGTPGTSGFSENNGTAIGAKVSNVYRLMTDDEGNIYFPDTGNNRIRKLTPIVTQTATTTTSPVTTTTPAVTTTTPTTTATSALPACVQEGTCKYTISTFAGSNPGDNDGTTSTATFQGLTMVIFDANKNMYVLNSNNKIRKIDISGNVTTIINSDKVPGSIAVDTLGNFYLYDRNNPCAKKSCTYLVGESPTMEGEASPTI